MSKDLIEKVKRMKELNGDEKLTLLRSLQDTPIEEIFEGSVRDFVKICEEIARDNDIDINSLSVGAAAEEEEDSGVPSMYKIVVTKFKPKNPKNPAEDLSVSDEFKAASETDKAKLLSTAQVKIVIALKGLIGEQKGWGLLDVKAKIAALVTGTPFDFPGEFPKNAPESTEKMTALKAAGLECEAKKI